MDTPSFAEVPIEIAEQIKVKIEGDATLFASDPTIPDALTIKAKEIADLWCDQVRRATEEKSDVVMIPLVLLDMAQVPLRPTWPLWYQSSEGRSVPADHD